jgi:hypothetical protein
MLSQVRSRLSYANVMATVAVFLALGGGAYAAIKLPKDSVKAKQIAKGAVRSSEVKNRSLLPADFKARSLPAGQRGPQGEPGKPGPGAVKLYFDRGPVDELVPLGSIGPWAIKARCAPGSVSVPAGNQLIVDGPGIADVAYTEEINGGTAAPYGYRQDLSLGNPAIGTGVKAPNVSYSVGTIVLSAGPAAPVGHIAYVAILDNSQQGHCSFIGTATPAG